MKRILHFFRLLWPIRYYALAVSALMVYYIWAAFSGTRILGDDNATTEARSGGPGNHFYHK